MARKLDRVTGIYAAQLKSDELGCDFIMLGNGVFALIDSEDWDKTSGHRWRAGIGGVRTTIYVDRIKRTLQLHRLIMDAPADREVDHKSRNWLDNRKVNLRLCSRAQNSANSPVRSHNKTSRFKGVKKYSKNTWSAYISINNRTKYIGAFKTAEDAALAYNREALIAFGEFAVLNQI